MAGPTAASTPANSQLKTSRIPVRQYSSQQEFSTHKLSQPFTDSNRSVCSVSVGNSSPPLLSSVSGVSSEHRNTSLHHHTGVTLTQRQQRPTVVMTTQQHHPTGVMRTQQHHPTGVMMTQQQHSTGVLMAQQHHSSEKMTRHQHHHTGVMVTQANSVSHINSTKHNHESVYTDNSPDISSGNNRNTHKQHNYVYACVHHVHITRTACIHNTRTCTYMCTYTH